MHDDILDIQKKIRDQRFPNEAAVSQGIVLRLLRRLGWNVDDIDQVWPEYAVEGTRVDFALCYPPQQPRVFIEVKQIGKFADRDEEQLSGYAYKQGVSLVVLTTGEEWNFYVPYGPGRFADRRVYRLDLLERPVQESVTRLRRYLGYEETRANDTFRNAQQDLQELLSRRETMAVLPEIWVAMLTEPAEELVSLLIERVERKSGHGPTRSDVQEFVRRQAGVTTPPRKVSPQDPPRRPEPTPPAGPAGRVVTLFGETVPVTTWREVLEAVTERLVTRDPSLPNRVFAAARPGRRPLIAPSREQLFPKAPRLADVKSNAYPIAAAPGWFLDQHQGRQSIEKSARKLCELAGARFGIDVIFPPEIADA